VDMALKLLDSLAEEDLLVRHRDILLFAHVLGLDLGYLRPELVIKENAFFKAADLAHIVVDVVEVDGIADLLVVNHDQSRCLFKLAGTQKSLLKAVRKLEWLPEARHVDLKHEGFVQNATQLHKLLLRSACMANQH